MNGAEESDWRIVPEKAANEAQAEELPEGRGQTKENTSEPDTGSTQSEETAIPGLERVRQKAKADKQVRFSALLHPSDGRTTDDQLHESQKGSGNRSRW